MPSQLLISSSNPNTGPEGMLHLVVLQVGTMISFAVVAVCEGTWREIADNLESSVLGARRGGIC
jgi:hypothetical protein